jgi:hypothetical protein
MAGLDIVGKKKRGGGADCHSCRLSLLAAVLFSR